MSRSKAAGISLVSILLGAGVLALMGFGLASAAPHQAPLVATNIGTSQVTIGGHLTTVPHVALTIETFPDSLSGAHGADGGAHPDWVTYSNYNLQVPAYSEVTITLNQFDGGGALNNSFFANVMGTTDGTASFDGKVLRNVDPSNIGHTFTLRGIPGNVTPLFVSVPIPANPGTDGTDLPVARGSSHYAKPLVVKFSFVTGAPGVYQWNCEFPCGGSRIGQFGEAMSTFGYMTGTLTVK